MNLFEKKLNIPLQKLDSVEIGKFALDNNREAIEYYISTKNRKIVKINKPNKYCKMLLHIGGVQIVCCEPYYITATDFNCNPVFDMEVIPSKCNAICNTSKRSNFYDFTLRRICGPSGIFELNCDEFAHLDNFVSIVLSSMYDDTVKEPEIVEETDKFETEILEAISLVFRINKKYQERNNGKPSQ